MTKAAVVAVVVTLIGSACSKSERDEPAGNPANQKVVDAGKGDNKSKVTSRQLPPVQFGDAKDPSGSEMHGAITYYGAAALAAPSESWKILASGMGESCGPACACMSEYAVAAPSEKPEKLMACGLACNDAAAQRFRTSMAASPANGLQGGAAWRTLIDSCGLEYYGLQAGQEWMFDDRFFVVERYAQRIGQMYAFVNQKLSPLGLVTNADEVVRWQGWKELMNDYHPTFPLVLPGDRAGLYSLPHLRTISESGFEDRLVIATADKVFIARSPFIEITEAGKVQLVDPARSYPNLIEVSLGSLRARLDELPTIGADRYQQEFAPVLLLADAGLEASRVIAVARQIGPGVRLAVSHADYPFASARPDFVTRISFARAPKRKVVVKLKFDGFYISGADAPPTVAVSPLELAGQSSAFDGGQPRPVEIESVDPNTTYLDLIQILEVMPTQIFLK